MIAKLFFAMGCLLFIGGVGAYGLYMTATPLPQPDGTSAISAPAHKYQAYNMVLYGSAFLFAYRIIRLLKELVE